MNSLNTSWTLTSDPVWPWSLSAFGPQALLAVALLLAVLTVWSYLGVRGASLPRVSLILLFRLVALVLAFLVLLRPSFALRDELRVPSLLVIAVDDSESTTIRDEFDSQSRWEYELATLRKCQPLLDRL